MKAKNSLTVPEVYEVLHEQYGDVKCFLLHGTPLQLLVATILSAQCTDKTVNQVTESLFRKYPAAADFAQAEPSELERDIHRCGYYRAKAAHIIGAARMICDVFHGEVPDRMEDLLRLPGVGRKTANVLLGDWFGVPGMPVDTHVQRLSGRMKLAKRGTPEQIETELCSKLEPEKWAMFSHLLILHGRNVCSARNPQCGVCCFAAKCPKKGVC